MIARLTGRFERSGDGEALVDVRGVGYQVLIPTSPAYRISSGTEISLLITTVVREDAILLFGFLTVPERKAFELLQGVSRVGPKLALAVLSHLEVGQLVAAILKKDVAALAKVSGLGKKTAERIILDCLDRVGELGPPAPGELEPDEPPEPEPLASPQAQTALSALVNLGFPKVQALKVVQRVLEEASGDLDEEAIIRAALKGAASGGGAS